MLKYSIFKFGAYEEHEPIYGPLADFLLQQSRKRAHDQRDILPEDLVYHEESLFPDYIEIKEHTSLIFADTLESLFAFMTVAGYAHWTIIKGETPKDNISTDSEAENNPEDKGNNGTGDTRLGKKIAVILPEQFYPETIHMPKRVNKAHNTLLARKRIRKTASSPFCRHVDKVLYGLHEVSGQPNVYYDLCSTPYPPLQIFEFIFRRFLSLRFAEDAFSILPPGSPRKVFLNRMESGDIYSKVDEQLPEGGITMFELNNWAAFDAHFFSMR